MSTWATSGGIGRDGATIRVENLDATYRRLEKFGASTKDLRDTMRPASRLLAKAVRRQVPVKERYLRASIRPRPRVDRADVVIGGRSAYYAPVVHFGWHKHNIAPNHFMWRALENSQNELIEKLHEGINTLARRQGIQIS